MKVTLSSINGQKNYIGTNERGQTIHLSGEKEGVGPMESVLIAGAACSSIDIDLILRKMRQDFTDVKVDTPYYAGGLKLVFRVQERRRLPENLPITSKGRGNRFCW